jgi:hypothetical protein
MALGSLLAAALLAAPPDGQSSTTLSEIISGTWDNLGNNGYQTGISLLVATLVVVALRNAQVNALVLVPVAIGAFWAGWLGWNTFTGEDNPLFPGDLQTLDLFDVATESATTFLVVAIGLTVVLAVAWKPKIGLFTKVAVLISAFLAANFIYNLLLALDVI